MRKWIILICFTVFSLNTWAQNLTQAEKLYQDGDFATAQRTYEQLTKTSAGAALYQVQLRLAACQYSQGEYLNAAKTIYGFPLPKDPLWKARFLLYRITMARQVDNEYDVILQEREIEDNKDMEQWTQAQWRGQIQQDFEQLWTLRNDLINAPIEQETLILNAKDKDTQRIPTLFDFVVEQWRPSLEESENKTKKLADILQTAYELEGKNRQNARIFWQTDFILLPLRQEKAKYYIEEPEAEDGKNTSQEKEHKKAVQTAIAQLNNLSGYTQPSSLWNRIKNKLTSINTQYGQSYAAYQAAQLLYDQDERKESLDVCQYAQEHFPGSYYTQQCQLLAQRIKKQELSFSADEESKSLVPVAPKIQISSRNVPTAYMRIYFVTQQELEKTYSCVNNGSRFEWNELLCLERKAISKLLTSGKSYQSLQQTISYDKPYFSKKTTLTLPRLDKGFYIILISSQENFNATQAPVSGRIINITDLTLFTTTAIEDNPDHYVWTLQSKPQTYTPPVVHSYTLNLKTGQAAPDTKISIKDTREQKNYTLSSTQTGKADLALPIEIQKNSNNYFWLSSLARNGKDTAIGQNISFDFYNQAPVRLFLQTDRAIYRPGQKVYVSVQGFQTTARGWEVLPGKSVELQVRSTNGKQIYQATIPLNDWGTGQLDFMLPQQDTLLGNFSIHAKTKINSDTYSAYHSFDVEEYKRPEYEITLQDATVPLAYGKKGTIPGMATTYAGTPLQNATVNYTISQQEYIPPFYWWRSWHRASAKQIAQGSTQTDTQGKFSFSFTPEPGYNLTQFVVKAEVLDQTGRAIETSKTYKVSKYPHLFKVNFAQGFYDQNISVPLADITLTNADGNAVTGSLTARITRVEDKPNLSKDPQGAPSPYNLLQGKDSLNTWYQNAKDTALIRQETLSFDKAEAQTLQLPALKEGIYRLTLQSDKAEKQSFIFVVVNDGNSLNIPIIALAQQSSYYPGQIARVLLGGKDLAGVKWVEVLYKGKFLRQSKQLPGKVSIFEYPVTEQERGGLAVRWFGVSNYQTYQSSTQFFVPFNNQELAVKLIAPEVEKPGQSVTWQLTALDGQNKPINGQASLTVYDKSLDYYAQKTNPFNLDSLFEQNNPVGNISGSLYWGWAMDTSGPAKPIDRIQVPQLPLINLVMPRRFYRNNFSYAAAPKMLMMAKGAAMQSNMAMEEKMEMAMDDVAVSTRGATQDFGSDETEGAEVNSPKDTLRTDFAETAYFNSLLPIKNGKAFVNFALPQSITTWNILGFALTKNAQLGTFTASTITRKDFMVRLHLPRFYRENDQGILQASVMNLTDRKITVPVTLSITQEKQNKTAAFGVKNTTQTLTVPANSTVFAQWEITTPPAPGLYQVTAAGYTSNASDGEQKELPVLPGTSRLLASTHVALKNGVNTLTLTELDGISDAKPELAALTVSPSLALTVLNKMPNLLENRYNDLVSSLNRYVPLAIVHTFYNQYPQLKQAVKKLPTRTGLTASWDEQNPLRLTVLEQTPWLQIAQGNTQYKANIINLFDDKIVSNKLEKERVRILKFQNANGSFSWFAGGPADTYLTLRALDAFSQAVTFAAPVPQAETQKAIAYVVPQIEKQLQEDKTGSVGAVSYALYAAYTLSAFPANWPEVAKAKPYIKKWMDYADEQSRFMTPLGQIHAAAVYHRLGDDVKANAYLDKVLARLKYNPLTGAYFAPEAQSWIWYQDTLSTQTATLKTLLEIRPDSDKIDPMVQWLLFNKQVTSWDNPAAAAKAVFALLDVMKARGALTGSSTYQIRWAGLQQKRTFEPFDWTQDLQWIKQGSALTPNAYTATVTKQSKMTDFASLNVIYTSAEANASPKGVLNVSREYFVRVPEGNTQKLRPLKNLEEVKVGDEVEVQLTLTSDSAFEYVLLSDPKPAGFENTALTSGWTWNPVSMYQEVRDADTNFFINRLPAGTVRVSYVLRPTLPGNFHAKPTQIQSMYAPQFGAHSAAEKINVGK